mgnify:CR=1 FL=1
MKLSKFIAFTLVIGLFLVSCQNNNTKNQNQEFSESKEQPVNNETEEKAVVEVMEKYKQAFQNLTTEGTLELFSEDSKVYESGGVEGTYKNYIEHHIGPELSHFNSFKFSDYQIEAEVDLPYAFVTETYVYTIDLKANPEKNREAQIIKKKGVATSVLKKRENDWKIMRTHSSSRDIR